MRSSSYSPRALWRMAVEQMRFKVDPAVYDSWLADPVGLSFEHEVLTVGVRTKIAQSTLEKRFGYTIHETLRSLVGMAIEVRFVVVEQESQQAPAAERRGESLSAQSSEPEMPPVLSAPISPVRDQQDLLEATEEAQRESFSLQQFFLSLDYQGEMRSMTFETFDEEVPGVQDAVIAALEFTLGAWGTLFIVGPPACGKTHISAATVWNHLEQGSCQRVFFAQATEIFSLLQSSFRGTGSGLYDTLLKQIREVDLLVLENVMHPPRVGREVTWFDEVLNRCLAHRLETGKMSIVTARPERLLTLDQRLLSRLSDQGLVRTAIIHRPGGPTDMASKEYR